MTLYTRGFSHFVTSMTAPIASGWSKIAGWDSHPRGNAAFARRTPLPIIRRSRNKAAEAAGEDVRFIGLNVRDDQQGARSFIAEFFPEAPIEHLFDPAGDIPLKLGGTRAVPLTFFYAPGGNLVNLHSGVIDERTLALEIDEIRSR